MYAQPPQLSLQDIGPLEARGGYSLPQGSEDALHPHPNVTSESQTRSLGCSYLQTELEATGFETSRCPALSALEGRHSTRHTISQSIFQSLTSICGLRLVFVSLCFVFFLVMNGYCQAGLGKAIGGGWAGESMQGFSCAGVIVYISFLGMKWSGRCLRSPMGHKR